MITFHKNPFKINTLTAEELAPQLQMSIPTLIRKVKQGIIPGHKPGRHWVFMADDIQQWLRDEAKKRQLEATKFRQSVNEVIAPCRSKDSKIIKSTTLTSRITAKELEDLLEPPTRHKRKNTRIN